MRTKHDTFRQDLPLLALDALGATETNALEAHVRECRECTENLAAYQDITAGLLEAVPPKDPPSSLRRSLQRQLGGAARRAAPGVNWPWSRVVTTSALVALIGLAVTSLLQRRALQQQQAEIDEHNRGLQTLVAMLAYPGTNTISFEQNGISGSALVDRQRGLLGLFVWNLPRLPADKTYQVWLIDASGGRTSGGFLHPEEGYPFVTDVVNFHAPLTGYTSLGVTTEPLGGSSGPTSPRIFGFDF